MSGNVWEWTRSRWIRKGDAAQANVYRYPYTPDDGREARPTIHACDQEARWVERGGSYRSGTRHVRAAHRHASGTQTTPLVFGWSFPNPKSILNKLFMGRSLAIPCAAQLTL